MKTFENFNNNEFYHLETILNELHQLNRKLKEFSGTGHADIDRKMKKHSEQLRSLVNDYEETMVELDRKN